jgi:alginate O-acetyltransferase complex protein AlgI
MVFTSPTFLFIFLPLVLAAFWLTPPRRRTLMLVVASWLFYAWGQQQLVVLLALSAGINWALAIVLDRADAARRRRTLLAAGVVVNIGALVYFKYTDFLFETVNALLARAGRAPVAHTPVYLPLAISFVTFEAVSYLMDVYRRHTAASRSPVHVAFYLSFFPHLIAGPILRFDDIAAALPRPTVALADFDRGVARFINGLGKKMLLANTLGRVVDQVFALPPGDLGTAAAWLGIVCYALQIYFDFSGYSDMAIGMGHMLGFTLPENFRLPYAADSIRDFWRRWHITLSSWFRDYLFIPLGGSRHGRARTARNLLLVFFLCGLWHGANRRFIVWGLFHGIFLVLERTRFGAALERVPLIVRRAYAFVVVLAGWVFFRAETFHLALRYLKAMAGFGAAVPVPARFYLTPEIVLALAVGLLLAMVPLTVRRVPALVTQTTVLALSLLYVAVGTYNPFIYFRF